MKTSMRYLFLLLLLATLVPSSHSQRCFRRRCKVPNYLKIFIKDLAEQTTLQQFYTEQRVRTEGQSGLKVVRQRRGGIKNYYSETHTGYSTAAIHDHSNLINTIGMGEFTAVMNGIEFSTRHNDYKLRMPHKTKNIYGATEDIPFPDVPPQVTSLHNVDDQIEEMREWFKAWRDQDYSVRDYRDYFKPVLCYLEGAWTNTGKKVDEPFSSDRHFIDAKLWKELSDKIRFVSYSGTKSRNENLAFLPTKFKVKGYKIDVMQWNYRILCHPLKDDLPLNRLRVKEDLSSRMMRSKNIYQHLHSRAALFELNSRDSKKFYERPTRGGGDLLDKLMAQIPGKNNYQGKLFDMGFDGPSLNGNLSMLDASRYHRWFKTRIRDAMGVSSIHRGYNDDFLFAAMTDQKKIAGMSFNKCVKIKGRKKKKCEELEQKWSYAIPLEIIYMTPLSKWNPYGLLNHGKNSRKNPATANGRNGNCKLGRKKALNGINNRNYYLTPQEFFTGEKIGRTRADTAKNVVCVLDEYGEIHKVRASGAHIFLPMIDGVGVLRQRFPIYPVHGEGSSVWKELNALRELVMDPQHYQHMYWHHRQIGMQATGREYELALQDASSKHDHHYHSVYISDYELSELKGGRVLKKMTDTADGHEHVLLIAYNAKKDYFYYKRCDNRKKCWDGHPRRMYFWQTSK